MMVGQRSAECPQQRRKGGKGGKGKGGKGFKRSKGGSKGGKGNGGEGSKGQFQGACHCCGKIGHKANEREETTVYFNKKGRGRQAPSAASVEESLPNGQEATGPSIPNWLKDIKHAKSEGGIRKLCRPDLQVRIGTHKAQ